MPKVRITKPFETSTHAFTPLAVGKEYDVADEIAAKWEKLGVVVVVAGDPAAAPNATQTPEGNTPPSESPEAPDYSKMKKVELLKACNERGIDVSESDTVAQLIEKLSA